MAGVISHCCLHEAGQTRPALIIECREFRVFDIELAQPTVNIGRDGIELLNVVI